MSSTTNLQVDLLALEANLVGIRELVGDRAILVAVKANAYGHGAVEISRFLEDAQLADSLGVANVGEAAELRKAGVSLPILCFSPCLPEQLPAAIQQHMELTVVDSQTILDAQEAASGLDAQVNVHLAVDTGMRRIGCSPAEAVQLAELIAECPALVLKGISTHLPESDDLAGYEFTEGELTSFRDVVDAVSNMLLTRGITPPSQIHASNSGGILGHTLDGLTMVRPGIMAYGYYPDVETPHSIELRQIASLTTRVTFLKQIPAGDTVGYGRSWTAPTDRWIATVGAGYGDGYSRLLSNRGRVLIGGHSYPIAGRVCMDQCMIDLGETNPGVSVGDSVTLIGRDGDEFIPTEEIADLMGTITYEVLCLISPRVGRSYSCGAVQA